jgi:hypothetical protein
MIVMFILEEQLHDSLIHNYRHHDQWSTVIVDFGLSLDLARQSSIDRSFRSKRKIAMEEVQPDGSSNESKKCLD